MKNVVVIFLVIFAVSCAKKTAEDSFREMTNDPNYYPKIKLGMLGPGPLVLNLYLDGATASGNTFEASIKDSLVFSADFVDSSGIAMIENLYWEDAKFGVRHYGVRFGKDPLQINGNRFVFMSQRPNYPLKTVEETLAEWERLGMPITEKKIAAAHELIKYQTKSGSTLHGLLFFINWDGRHTHIPYSIKFTD